MSTHLLKQDSLVTISKKSGLVRNFLFANDFNMDQQFVHWSFVVWKISMRGQFVLFVVDWFCILNFWIWDEIWTFTVRIDLKFEFFLCKGIYSEYNILRKICFWPSLQTLFRDTHKAYMPSSYMKILHVWTEFFI